MRKSVVLLLLLFMFCSAPGPALAGPYATEITQLLNHAELVLSYAVQANQLATQIKMLADAVKNTVMNPHQLFWNIQADLNALAGIVQGGRSLAYSLGNLDALWQQNYPVGVKIMVLFLLIGVGMSLSIGWVAVAETVATSANPAMGALDIVGESLIFLALCWFVPKIVAGVLGGSPAFTGGEIIAVATPIAYGTVMAAQSAVSLASSGFSALAGPTVGGASAAKAAPIGTTGASAAGGQPGPPAPPIMSAGAGQPPPPSK